jgi:uncharacterized protein YndB with AHSA1/START domain
MTTMEQTGVETTQVYRVYIKATPQAVWDAITRPEWTVRYGYTNYADYDLREGGAYVSRPSEAMIAAGEQMGFPTPDVVVDGEVLEVDPPRRLVQTWRMLMDPTAAAEGFTRLTYEIDEIQPGVSRLTVIHDLEGAPALAAIVGGKLEDAGEGAGGGWAWVLSDLKTLLETGEAFTAGS